MEVAVVFDPIQAGLRMLIEIVKGDQL